MKAAIITHAGQAPIYGDFPEPVAAAGEQRIVVRAAALSQVTRARAAGTHYSGAGELPFIPGMDGVGTLDDGRRVYFVMPRAPFGGMTEQTVVAAAQCLPLPDALDDVHAAALAIPAMSSWAACRERAKLQAGETVLINGATGTSGRLAVQIAKYLGAKKVIATGRDPQSLHALTALGADTVISLTQDTRALEHAFCEQFAEGIDVVLDYLWGNSAELLLVAAARAGREAVPVRFVQIGAASGADIKLPAAALRSSATLLMGSGLNSIPFQRIVVALNEVLLAAVDGRFAVDAHAVALAGGEQAWDRTDIRERMVFVP